MSLSDIFMVWLKWISHGTSLAAQWLRLHTSNAGGTSLIPVLGIKILYATWHGQKRKSWQFPCGLGIRTQCFTAITQVQSLVGELRSHKTLGPKKKKIPFYYFKLLGLIFWQLHSVIILGQEGPYSYVNFFSRCSWYTILYSTTFKLEKNILVINANDLLFSHFIHMQLPLSTLIPSLFIHTTTFSK